MDWMPIMSKANLRELVALWFVLLGVLYMMQFRSKRASGIPLAFAMQLSLIHLTGAMAYGMDFYTPRAAVLSQMGYQLKYTFLGFWVSVIGLAAFVVGVGLNYVLFKPALPPPLAHRWPAITTKLPGTLLLGACLFFVLGPLLRRIPSMASVSVAGANLSVMAVVLFAYFSYNARETSRFIKWVAGTMAFPVVTVLFLGFAGYGIAAATNSWQFIIRFFRPRALGIFVLLLACYLGLSVYVNYMRERGGIRDAVWKGQNMSVRVEKTLRIFTNFEFFNPYVQEHLEIVDLRLNQNDLVGRSVEYIAGSRVEFAQGGTLYAAAVAWIPRILWPNKPKTGGSGSLASRYTGMKFGDGTSVGVGLVMELYINWGMSSVIIGFLIYGLTLGYMDQRAGGYMSQGDYWSFVRWALPGLGLMQPGGAMTEAVGGAAACYVLVTAIQWRFFSQYYDADQGQLAQVTRGSKHAYPTSGR